jgi:DnaJ-domain-containing protein 1
VKSPFEVLEIAPFLFASAQDQQDLKAIHLKLSRKFHPDRFIHASEEAQKNSEERSAEINRSLGEILDPWIRVENVLKNLGIDLGSQKDAKIPDLAMEYFQVQEDLEERPQSAASISENFLKKLSQRSHDCDQELIKLASPYRFSVSAIDKSPWPPTAEELQRLLELCQRRNYIKRMIQNLNPTQAKGAL